MNDSGAWHKKMRKDACKNNEFVDEYNQFKLEFEIAEKLKVMREKQHMSLTAVAERMHSSKSAVSRLESTSVSKKHSPSISTLVKYAKAIGCTLKVEIIK